MSNVVIVEKVKNIREGIKILINRFSNLDCYYSFESFDLFIQEFHNINPNLLLLDLEHKNITIIEEIKKLKLEFPALIIIVLTMNDENEIVFDALSNGATAYVHKNAPSQKLVKVLEDAAKGKMVVNSLIARKTVRYIEDNMLEDRYLLPELKLLEKVIEGNNLTAISKSMNMNLEDIKVIFSKIFEKLFIGKNCAFKYKNLPTY